MSTLAQIRSGLQTRLQTISGLRVYSYQPADVPNELPAAVIQGISGNYAVTFGGAPVAPEIRVTLFVGHANREEAWIALDTYISPTGDNSVGAAIRGDPTLGLSDVSAGLLRFENAGVRQVGGVEEHGALVGVDFILAVVSV